MGGAREHRAALDLLRALRGVPGAVGAERAHDVARLPHPAARRATAVGGGVRGHGRRREGGRASSASAAQK